MFNNREIATAIWLTLLAAWLLRHSEIRTSIARVIRAFLAWKVLAGFAGMALYTAATLFALYAVGFWQPEMIKDTAVWYVFTACAMVMRFTTSRETDNILKHVLLDNVKLIIVVEFLMDTYVMSLPVELVLVPAVTFLTLIMTVAQLDEKHAPAVKLSAFLLGTIGVIVLGFAISRAVGDYRSLGTMDTVRRVTFPPLMSVLVVPFIYTWLCICDYELIYMRLALGHEKTPAVVRYAKKRIFFYCGLSLPRLRDLTKRSREITKVESNEDVDRLLRPPSSVIDPSGVR